MTDPAVLPKEQLISASKRYAKAFDALRAQAALLRESLIYHGATPAMIPGDVEDVLTPAFEAQIEGAGVKAYALYGWILSKLDVAP